MYEGLDLFNLDVFIPVNDEEELERFYHTDTGAAYVAAGIVFDSLNLSSSIKTGKIRIRTNISQVPSTASYKR